ncbi:DUF1289 domain-containing protein [Halioxenophilus sp. WMMB6]|uniref:DUF1289 domain-containing protein n=1 Tax=Halioxenophilus sp. WMMB6 TaxID=3073815 RepID=UPI00295EF300|nr:DUF1289 domain-containing protein [Halioxenophilus sp. WMMB6]
MIFKPVKTPCVGICSTGIGDDVCRGCKRFSHEVIHWNGYDNDQRRVIANRLASFLAQVVANHFFIIDAEKLQAQLRHQQISYQSDQDPMCWVFDLLKAGASQITDISVYGVAVKREFQHLTLVELKQSVDQHFYLLSKAHYDRYFRPPQLPVAPSQL